MSKKNLILTSLAISTSVISVATAIVYAVIKKKQNTEDGENNQADNFDDYSGKVIDNESFDTDETNHDNADINEFTTFLMNNGRDSEEVKSITETITMIKQLYPDEYTKVKTKMTDIMNSEFDLANSLKFDEENFILVYGSMDPSALFIKNGFNILAMGPDCQNDMLKLAIALSDLKDQDNTEFANVMYEIYHVFHDNKTEDIDSTIFEKHFKQYVDKYLENN